MEAVGVGRAGVGLRAKMGHVGWEQAEWRGKDVAEGEPAEPGKLVADTVWVPFVQIWVNAELFRHL